MIPFTQYLRPDGRRKAESIERPPEVEAAAHAIIAAGFRFEAEVLRTGFVSFEVLKEDEHGDADTLAMTTVANGPKVPEAVDRLVRNAMEALANRREAGTAEAGGAQ